MADLLGLNIQRDTDNPYTTGVSSAWPHLRLSSSSAPPSTCQPGFFCLWTGQVGKGGRVSSALRGPGQANFSHSSKSLQKGRILPKSPALGGGRGQQGVPLSTNCGTGAGRGVKNNRTRRGQDPRCSPAGGPAWRAGLRPEGACTAPAKAPLRLERYVGWNLNTGCEVQRKGTGGGGGGREREGQARSVPEPLTPSGPRRGIQAHWKRWYYQTHPTPYSLPSLLLCLC